MTSGEYTLAKWLDIFDLDFSDIVVIDKPGVDSLESMDRGTGVSYHVERVRPYGRG